MSRTAAALGCDVVLVPASRLSGERFARACRRTGSPPVVAVKPWDARARAPRPRFHLDHLFTRHRLSAYVGGDLRADERPRVRRHIEECEDCGRVERSLRRLLGELRLLGGRRPPHLVDAAIDRVRSAERSAEHAGRR